MDQEISQLTSRVKTASTYQSITIQDQELVFWCSTTTVQLNHSLTHASNTLSKETILFTWPPRTLSSRDTTVDSRTSSKTSINQLTKKNSNLKNFGTSTGSLMIWLLKSSREKEDTFGLAKTMMVMSNQILLLKVFMFLFRLWIFGTHDFSLSYPWWSCWSRSCSRNSH